MSRLDKTELEEWLRENNIEFPSSATVRHLRSLYSSHVGAQGGAPDESHEGFSCEEELDMELRILEKRKRIASLRNELDSIECFQVKPPTIQDVTNIVQRFSGGEKCDANRWLSDFESTCDSLGADAEFKFKCIRRLMEPGTEADWFLRVDKSVDYNEFRTGFLENFGHTYTVAEIVDILRKTTFVTSRVSVPAYILKMQEVASRVNMDESLTVQFIIDGFQDRSANIAVLYPAKDLAHLKQLSRRYVQLREMFPTSVTSQVTRQKMKPSPSKTDLLRCYNCSGVGHLSAACKEPRRAKGSCFRCGSTQHQLRDCTKTPPRDSKQVALTDEFRQSTSEDRPPVGELEASLSELNIVSIAFSIDKCLSSCTSILSLLDTGSPISFVRRSVVPKSAGPRRRVNSGYKSIGNYPLCTYGIIEAIVNFRDRKTMLKVHVVPDNYLCVPLLLGRDFMKETGITLYDTKLVKVNSNLRLEVGPEPNRIIISGKVLHCVFDYSSDACPEPFTTCYQCDHSQLKVDPNIQRTTLPIANSIVKGKLQPFDLHSEKSPSVGAVLSRAVIPNSVLIEENIVPLPSVPTYSDSSDSVALSNSEHSSVLIEDNITKSTSEYYSVPDVFYIDSNFDECDYIINRELSVDDRNEIIKIIRENYLDLQNIPEQQHSYEMRLKLTSDIPISFPPRRLSYSDKLEVDRIVDDLLNSGIIQPSNSPYAFPIVLRTKKSGEKRMCVDYRALNKLTVRDSYPMPLIDDCLERVEGKKYFTVLDLKNGFHQIRVAQDTIPYTAFVTPNGQYEYLKMPFGLRNAPAVFQRFVNFILVPFIREGTVTVYLDDITIATSTIQEHFNVLQRVLRILAGFRLEIKFQKCQFCFTEIELLGFTVNETGIKPNNTHLIAIEKLPFPKDIKQLNKCLGLFSYFRRFVPFFSTIAIPLRALTNPGVQFNFDEKCEKAFEILRNRLITSPVLALYSPKRESELHCDASSEGFGGILMQKQDDGKFHPVGYFSKRTSAAESRYHSFELETLAIIYSLRKFRIYLEGIPFRIITDCNSLTMTLNKKSVNARIARWALELENYHYTVQHRNGKLMNHVDALSRLPSATIVTYDNHDQVVSAVNPDDLDFQLQVTQSRDENIVELREKLERGHVKHYSLDDGLVYRCSRNGKLLFYVPKEMTTNVIRTVHEKLCHMGITKTHAQLQMNYWFPNMKAEVEKYVKNCVRCILHSEPHSDCRILYSIPKKPIPFDTIHIDHFGPLPSIVSRRKHILVIVDAFTKFVKLYPVNSTSTKEVCACLDKYFCNYSRPRRIVSDRGTCFTSLEFGSYLLDNNIEHVKIATASAQANGQVERINRIIKSMLAKLTEPVLHSDWCKMLSKVEYAINNSVHVSTSQTPSILLYGAAQRGCEVDVLSEFLNDKVNSEHTYPARDLESLRRSAADSIERSQNRNNALHEKKHKSPIIFSEGDYVVIRNIDTSIGTNKKFVPKFKGPYRVHKVLPNDRYVVRDIENGQISQMPYDGIIESSRMKRWADWRDCD